MPKVTKLSKKKLRKYYIDLDEIVYRNELNPKDYEKRIYLLKKRLDFSA